tara:strand:+ start:253 stop:492 length:240 start_codon:yes stop_codon:yes gene_type:complete
MAEFVPDKIINCTGLSCPEPILQTTLTIKKMAAGEILLMSATDPVSTNDMRVWSSRSGHKIVKEEKEGGTYKFYVQKTT